MKITDRKGNTIYIGGSNVAFKQGGLETLAPYFAVYMGECAGTQNSGMPVGTRLEFMDAPITVETL